MSLSLENTIIVRSLCFCVSKGSTETPDGLAWKSGRGLSAWQMYVWVSWEPGRALTSFPLRAGIWLAGSSKEAWRCCSCSCSITSFNHKNEEQGKVSRSDKKLSRRAKGSLSTLIVLFESRVTDLGEPVSKEGVCRSMDSLLSNTYYTRR
jgi:hypothetical protein